MKNKTTAAILSLLFGGLGFHKFYLNKTGIGLIYLIFFWTYIPLIIGIIEFFILLNMNKKEFDKKYNNAYLNRVTKYPVKENKYQRRRQMKTNPFKQPVYSNEIDINDFIIDITEEGSNLNINYAGINISNMDTVPYWTGRYIYSNNELEYATQEQKKFYYYFKKEFINGKIVDIDDNTNYAFILYFDLLDEYYYHRDLKLLEKQFKLLGECCSKTKKYSLSSLQELLKEKGDSKSIEQFEKLQVASYQYENGYSDYDPDAYKLGKIYQKKLNLDKIEVAWLNKFWNPSNVFLSIEGCAIETVKQYILVLKELDKILIEENSSINKEENFLKKKIIKLYKKDAYYNEYYDKSYQNSRAEAEIYLAIFKRVENSVRESFGHKRKLTISSPIENFESRIGEKANSIIEKFKGKIKKPIQKTQIELNTQNVNRWKIEFANIKAAYKPENIKETIKSISLLEKVNQKNPNIENVLFEASKLVAKQNKVLSLQYYIKYIHYDLGSKKIDNKQLTKTIQKSLFKTEEQLSDFRTIVDELNSDLNLKKALEAVSKIYIPKRKKIVLDKSEIKRAKQKHDGTVELLNQYLEDNEKNTDFNNLDNEEVSISLKTNEESDSLFIAELQFNEVQKELILSFVEKSFQIQKEQVETLAIKNGLFKNQLIDSINEACFDFLEGEALIEEDGDNYVIEESFYNELLK